MRHDEMVTIGFHGLSEEAVSTGMEPNMNETHLQPENAVADYTVYTDGVTFLGVGSAGLHIAGYGPGEPTVQTRVCAGHIFVTFIADKKDVVFDALRRSRREMDSLLGSLVKKGHITVEGEDRPVTWEVKKIKISVDELIDKILAGCGQSSECLEQVPVDLVFG